MEMQQKDSGAQQNVPGTLDNNQDFGTFINAIDKAGLKDSLNGAALHTVFAPTNAAFAKLPSGTLDRLFKPENKDELVALVNYHVVTGSKSSADVGKWRAARTVQGQPAPIVLADGKLSIDGAQVTRADIPARNGVIHAIDKVNIPSAKTH